MTFLGDFLLGMRQEGNGMIPLVRKWNGNGRYVVTSVLGRNGMKSKKNTRGCGEVRWELGIPKLGRLGRDRWDGPFGPGDGNGNGRNVGRGELAGWSLRSIYVSFVKTNKYR